MKVCSRPRLFAAFAVLSLLPGVICTANAGSLGNINPEFGSSKAQVATRCYANEAVAYSPGTALSTTYRIQHVIPYACSSIRLEYGNFNITSAGTESSPGNTITVSAALEYDEYSYQLTFGGQTSVSIAPGQLVTSDPLKISIPAGTTVFSRTCPSVSKTGLKWPYTTVGQSTDGMSAVNTNATLQEGGLQYGANNQYVYGPSAMLGTISGTGGSVALVGDSIMQGVGDIAYENGFGVRALNNEVPFIRMAEPGTTAAEWANSNNTTDRMSLASHVNYVVCNLGTNDLGSSTVSQIESNLTTLWNRFNNMGIKVYQTTLTPKTYSTDNWLSNTNQTPYGINISNATNARPIVITTSQNHLLATGETLTIQGVTGNTAANGTFTITVLSPTTFSLNGTSGNGTFARTGQAYNYDANRIAINKWIRSQPLPLAGYFDTASKVEVNESNSLTVNGGYWMTAPIASSEIATSGTADSAFVTHQDWTTNEFADLYIIIVGGTDVGQTAYVVSNDADNVYLNKTLPKPIDSTTSYYIDNIPTNDGVHPTVNLHIAMSDAIDNSIFIQRL